MHNKTTPCVMLVLMVYFVVPFVLLCNKEELKKDNDVPHQEEAANEWTEGEGERAMEVKKEDDQQIQQSRKRPYDDGRGYGYYEHREDRR